MFLRFWFRYVFLFIICVLFFLRWFYISFLFVLVIFIRDYISILIILVCIVEWSNEKYVIGQVLSWEVWMEDGFFYQRFRVLWIFCVVYICYSLYFNFFLF